MKKIGLVLILVGLSLILAGICVQSQSQPFEIIEICTGSNPQWSSDGTKLAFWRNDGIYIVPSDGTGEPTKVIDTFGQDLMWASDSELVYWQRKITKTPQEGGKTKKETVESVRLVNLKGEEKVAKEGSTVKGPFKLSDGSVGCYREGESFDIISYGKFGTDALKKHRGVGLRRRASDNECCEIWLTNADGTFNKRITTKLDYKFPRISPDGTKILVKKSPNADLIILDINGKELVDLKLGVRIVGPQLFEGAPATSVRWSPDSQRLIYKLSINDGEEVFNHDIYLINSDGAGRIQITDTPDEIEGQPEWSPDGTKIAYSSGPSGKIFVVKLQQH